MTLSREEEVLLFAGHVSRKCDGNYVIVVAIAKSMYVPPLWRIEPNVYRYIQVVWHYTHVEKERKTIQVEFKYTILYKTFRFDTGEKGC